jgi:hypothetical protein
MLERVLAAKSSGLTMPAGMTSQSPLEQLVYVLLPLETIPR